VRKVKQSTPIILTTAAIGGGGLIYYAFRKGKLSRAILCRGYLTKDERQVPIHGVSWHPNGTYQTLEEYASWLPLVEQTGFNVLRIFLTAGMRDRIDDYIELFQASGYKLVPVLFHQYEPGSQARLWTTPVSQLKTWVDYWMPLDDGDQVVFWEVFNELYSNANAEIVQTMMDYVKTKTGKPVTISFHEQREDVFQRFIGLCDIVSRHFYKVGLNPYNDFKTFIKNLASYGKPYIISEWGYKTPTENDYTCQSCYCANILHLLKDVVDRNFQGYIVHQLKDRILNDFWGIFKLDGTRKPAVAWFP